jgi:threonine synthase
MLPDGTAVAAAATTVAAARAAVAAGAVLVDLTGAGRPVMTEVRNRYPGILICAPADWADLVRDPATARRTGAILVCADPAAATAAEAGGIGRRGILVEAAPARAAELIAAGWRVLVDCGQVTDPHAAAAVAALSAWLGAAAVRSDHVAAVRRAVDMAGAITGGRLVTGGCARP